MTDIKPIRVGLDASLSPWQPEVKYTFRTLLRVAGFPYEFVRACEVDEPQALDIYYGPRSERAAALVSIAACGEPFDEVHRREPRRLYQRDGLEFLDFGAGPDGGCRSDNAGLHFSNDIIFACYWLLTGAREPHYRRDRRDNLRLEGSFFLENSLASRPLASIYGALLRGYFQRAGYAPLAAPWASSGGGPAFAFSHDVDYPQIIRWIECLRLLGTRGLQSRALIGQVLRGASHFWKFSDWVEYEQKIGAHPAFYFMARKGSLLRYALGTPDAFYDIRAPEFAQLFRELRDQGCEVGLHASYHAYRSVQQLRAEKQALEEAAGVPVHGNRHHYWHLDPAAPHETLRLHEQAGLLYDSSLAFEFYPGFRRGICHPFRVFHAGERRELNVVELPPAWTDDHFHRRLAHNRVVDPEAYARRLMDVAGATGGMVVVDYHVRGMNADFFPHYGPWLMAFVQNNLDSSVAYRSPGELARMYVEYESRLAAGSRDLTEPGESVNLSPAPARSTIGPERQVTPARTGSPIEIDFLQAGEWERWDAFVAAHPHGNIYHTLAWKTVTEEGFGHRAYYLRALDASGRFAGVLPLFLVKGLFGRRLVSVPLRDRGGVLAEDRQIASRLVGRAIGLSRELGCQYLELRSLEEMDPQVSREHGLRCKRNWITTRLDLAPGIERLWKALDRDAVRWSIHKARREGVRIEVDETLQGAETFYEMFVRTRCSMGIPPFSKSLFASVWRHLIAQGKANLVLAWKDAEPINGMINLFSRDTFIPAYAAPQNRWRKYHPNECMFWHTIESAAEQGFRYYDFGADSPHQTGLLWFKQKWGGVQQPMFYYYFLNGRAEPPNFDSSAPAYSWLRKAWSLLPAPLARRLGGWVTRQLS